MTNLVTHSDSIGKKNVRLLSRVLMMKYFLIHLTDGKKEKMNTTWDLYQENKLKAVVFVVVVLIVVAVWEGENHKCWGQ